VCNSILEPRTEWNKEETQVRSLWNKSGSLPTVKGKQAKDTGILAYPPPLVKEFLNF